MNTDVSIPTPRPLLPSRGGGPVRSGSSSPLKFISLPLSPRRRAPTPPPGSDALSRLSLIVFSLLGCSQVSNPRVITRVRLSEATPHNEPLHRVLLVVVVQVYDYWLEDMYLNNRLALPVNSSPVMVFPKQTFTTQKDALRYVPVLLVSLSASAPPLLEMLPRESDHCDVTRGAVACLVVMGGEQFLQEEEFLLRVVNRVLKMQFSGETVQREPRRTFLKFVIFQPPAFRCEKLCADKLATLQSG